MKPAPGALIVLLAACDPGRSVVGGGGGGGGAGTDAGPADARRSNIGVPTVTPAAPPPSFGAGFTDLSGVMEAAPPFTVTQVVRPGDPDPDTISGFFADVDGDGRMEVVVSPAGVDATHTTHVYGYDAAAGALVDRGPVAINLLSNGVSLLGVLDLDGDGLPDLFSNRPGSEIAWGVASGVPGSSPLMPMAASNVPGYSSLYFDDFDQDGWLDVLGGNQNCCIDCTDLRLILRTSPRGFALRTDLLPEETAATAFSVLAGRFGDDSVLGSIGQPCGNLNTPSFYRQARLDEHGFPRYEAFEPIPLDAFVRRESPPQNRNNYLSMWAPMGASAQDIDSDGVADLAVSLNFFSGVFQKQPAWPFIDWSTPFGTQPPVAASGKRQIPWGTALVDLDDDGRPDLVAANGNDHATWTDPSLFIGPQHATMYWNSGGFGYREMTEAVHMGRTGQWRALAVDDLDGDGDADVIVGGQGEWPRVYRNDLATGNHGLALSLRGTTSNVLGMGARVEVERADGSRVVRFASGIASPMVTSAPRVFVGLGPATSAPLVRVVWPSGTVQELRDVPAGARRVEEPASIALDPPSRHLPADGHSLAHVRVTPRAPDGSVRVGAPVEVTLRYGGGTLSAGAWNGDAWEADVTAPPGAGSVVLEVRVDGVLLGVRPRLWWD